MTGSIDDAVATHCREWLFVHAGAVAWRGHVILIPGRSRSGKSTLVIELVRRGATYYSDEYAVLDREGRVHPYPRLAMVRDSAGGFQPVRLEGKDEVAKAPLPIAVILSTTYQPEAGWQPEIVRGARAVLPLIDGTIHARTERRRTLGLAAHLAPQVVALQGLRPDAAVVAPQILALIDDAIVARAFTAERTAKMNSKGLAPTLAAIAHTRYWPVLRGDNRDEGGVVPAPYVRFEHFLSPEEHRQLLDFALARQADFRSSQVVDAAGNAKVDADFRVSSTLYELDAIWGLFDKRLRAMLAGIRRELGVPWFPLGQIERQLTAHQEGGHFGPHSDNGHAPVGTRRITCVYHFHARPRRFSGGDLHLYGKKVTAAGIAPAKTYTPLMPLDNSVVFFASDTMHAVRPVRCGTGVFEHSRFALNIWFHAGEDPLAAHRRAQSE